MNRRSFLLAAAAGSASLAALSPERAFATAASDWTLGWADLPGDIAPHSLRRIAGRAPADLTGTLHRNGPARFRRAGGDAGHWFDGDGLVRAFSVEDGEARLSARFVDTAKRRRDEAAGAVVTPGFATPGRPGVAIGGPDDANAANTSILSVGGGEVWALWEGGSPTRLDARTLETRGLVTFGENLAGMPFLAHPRREAGGRVWSLGMSGGRAIVWRLAANGALEAATPIALPRASYLHDFTATERHLVIVLQPWLFTGGRPPFADSLAWRPEEGVQVLVLDKADLSQRRLYELPAFSFFHLSDAREDGGDIRFEVCATEDPSFAIREGRDLLQGRRSRPAADARLAEVVLRANGQAEMRSTGLIGEFPQSDPRRAGLSRRLTAYVSAGRTTAPWTSAVAVRDFATGAEDRYDFGADQLTEELVWAPRPGRSGETDAWLIGSTLSIRERATELHVFDPRRVAAGPVVSWRAEAAMPLGFHGAWTAA